ncbi:MAG: hypothetical protein U0935_22350 [Pirellulales bacterium]
MWPQNVGADTMAQAESGTTEWSPTLRQPRARRQQLLAEVRDDADPSSDD